MEVKMIKTGLLQENVYIISIYDNTSIFNSKIKIYY